MTKQDYERWCDLIDREAVGETLSEAEQQFVRTYALENPACQAELAVWNQMGDLSSPPVDDLRAHALAKKALEELDERRQDSAASVSSARARHTGRWALAGGAIVAAAAAAVLMAAPEGEPSPAATLVYAEGPVSVSGQPAEVGGQVTAGATLEVGSGVACLAVDPKITLCLGEESKLRLSELGQNRRLDLLSGRAAASLDPLRAGGRFSIVADETWVTAVGTAFSVAFADEGIETVVYEGKVTIGGAEGGDLVPTHKLGLSSNRGVRIDWVEGRPSTSEWRALEQVTGQHFEAPAREAPAAVEAKDDSQVAERAVDSEAEGVAGSAAGGQPEAPSEPKAVAPAPSAADLLAQARRQMRSSRWAEAAQSYRRLVQGHPGAPEAHAVLVSLGEVELDRLGQAATALGRFDAYLARGGPLAVEARLGRIRALRALGHTDRERQAIEAFLAAHPDSVQHAHLRSRLESLSP